MDSIAIAAIAIGLSSLVTSAGWSMNAFAKYIVISERLAILETKINMIAPEHEQRCIMYRPPPP